MPSGTAIFHCDVSITKRTNATTGNRQSAVAAAAYRAGENLTDLQTGEMHNYSNRKDVHSSTILAPADAPEWTNDRTELWNRHEAKETRKDAQICRNVLLSLPRALDADENCEMVLSWAKESFVSRGMVADVAFHDMEEGNPHAHIMLTMRHLETDGFGNKNRDWNQFSPSMLVPKEFRETGFKTLVDDWRVSWSTHVNSHLEKNDVGVRISHLPRSEQTDSEGFEGSYLPQSAYHMEARGEETIAGEKKFEAEIRNEAREQREKYSQQLEFHYAVENQQSWVQKISQYWEGLAQRMIDDYAERFAPSWLISEVELTEDSERDRGAEIG